MLNRQISVSPTLLTLYFRLEILLFITMKVTVEEATLNILVFMRRLNKSESHPVK